MRARNISRVVIITTVLATFVLYLCASVSKILPFLLVAGLVAFLAMCAAPRFRSFAAIIRRTQKTE
ncbi:hypothetical protein SAMN02745823_02855 [Sporobacter termitidis DSM 10068]|uniref:Uncharacterized protein n=1 Tax=Sporobacter termitidis DSM 10068 TaxID=1123282 RepID=A0A1M5YUL3_9FIRM|nr:hypothetical protein [Sporobacter termitidis]SHI15802.1 hypothetical protein SAMN02745823_02855 [Sporobacter termitidis DSM 10068]